MNDNNPRTTIGLTLSAEDAHVLAECLKTMHSTHIAYEGISARPEDRKWHRHRAQTIYELMGRFEDALGDPF